MFYLYCTLAIVWLLFLSYGAYRLVTGWILPPSHFPKNIPTIPFYYTLIPLFKDVDQEALWHKYLKRPLTEHGAVKIYFGGAWNVLITKPEYINQVFKQDDVFPKAGNHIKNPHSILALYTGENIISTINDQWRGFAAIIKPGLQADIDTSIITRNMDKLTEILLKEQERKGSVVMPKPLQDYALANLSEALLGASFQVSQSIHCKPMILSTRRLWITRKLPCQNCNPKSSPRSSTLSISTFPCWTISKLLAEKKHVGLSKSSNMSFANWFFLATNMSTKRVWTRTIWAVGW